MNIQISEVKIVKHIGKSAISPTLK